MAQKFAQKFYKSKAWQETRDAYAASVGWLCERCFAVGMYTPGEIVHHKVYLTAQNIGDPAVSLAWDNLELLCRDCHANVHKKQSPRRYIIADDGCVMVTTPPLSDVERVASLTGSKTPNSSPCIRDPLPKTQKEE